jgi:thioredoxin 1
MNSFQQIAGGTILAAALLGGVWALARANRSGTSTPPSSTPEKTMSNVIHLNAAAFPKVLAQPKPVIIDFWAPWCGPCRTQGPILDQVSLQMGDRAIVTKVNVDEERELAAQFGVQSIPTLVILHNGKPIKQFVGVQQAPTLIAALEAAGS